MSRKKIKADNVEQLFEIVRAIQNGEEPDDALRRKELEGAPEADSPNPYPEEEGSREKRSKKQTEKPAKEAKEETANPEDNDFHEDDFSDDEFDRILDEDEELDLRPVLDRISSGAGKVFGTLKGLGGKLKAGIDTGKRQNSTEEHVEVSQDAEHEEASGKVQMDSENNIPEEHGKKTPQAKAVSFLSGLRETLEGKGIHRRELIMLGMGAVLVLLIIAFIAGGLSASHKEKVKSKNVTADEGLTVTVEQQPEQWCSSYPVVLRFRAQGQTITKVTINGEDYVPDENDHIVVTATDYLLEAVAVTEQGTLNARIEIPMIDSQPPVVNVAREKNVITVTAADARSTVTKIYYAVVHDGDYIQLPEYQLYSEPLTFESDTSYYFYAVDKAGNRSNPVVTTTETASEMSFDKEELALFPEETGYLTVEATPANALLNNLRYESANPDVVTVTGTGAVTAVGEGNTVIKVSADGVSDISCPVVVSEERTVTISAIGDCTLGTDASFNADTSFNAFDAVYGHEYFFRNVREVLENDDATFANLEGPLTTSDTKTTVEQFAFKGDPGYTGVLTSGSVDVVTLANNHMNDYGTQGLEDTKSALAEAGIDYCNDDEIALKDVNGIRTAFIGIYELNDGIQCESRVRETIASAKAQGAQLVIIAFHWGSERSNQPDETQQSLAHTAVDCGADLVVGHHPHVLQGIEKYNGKYIVYSLGNFCFGGNSAPSDMDTIIFRQTFSVTRNSVRTDDNIEIIPCSISSADGYNNYQPTPVADMEADRIIQRLNEYSSSFGQTFTASDGMGDPTSAQVE